MTQFMTNPLYQRETILVPNRSNMFERRPMLTTAYHSGDKHAGASGWALGHSRNRRPTEATGVLLLLRVMERLTTVVAQ